MFPYPIDISSPEGKRERERGKKKKGESPISDAHYYSEVEEREKEGEEGRASPGCVHIHTLFSQGIDQGDYRS